MEFNKDLLDFVSVPRFAVEVLLQKLKMPPGGAGAAGTVPRYKVECHPQLVARGTTAPPPAQSRLVLK